MTNQINKEEIKRLTKDAAKNTIAIELGVGISDVDYITYPTFTGKKIRGRCKRTNEFSNSYSL